MLFAEIIDTGEFLEMSLRVFSVYFATLSKIYNVNYMQVVGKINTICVPTRTGIKLILLILFHEVKCQISLKLLQEFLHQTHKHTYAIFGWI